MNTCIKIIMISLVVFELSAWCNPFSALSKYFDEHKSTEIKKETAHNKTSQTEDVSNVQLKYKNNHYKIMNYPMNHIVERYKKDYKVSDEAARIHEKELKRFFIMCGAYPKEVLEMWSVEVDNLWHTFILYTKEYEKFCLDHFGHFLHHCPV